MQRLQRHSHGAVRVIVNLAMAGVALFWPAWQPELEAQSYISLERCREAQAVSENPNRAVGDLTRSLVQCFDDVLQAIDVLAQEANAERMEFVAPLLDVYRELRIETVTVMGQLPDVARRRDVRQFEEATIIGSRILEEAIVSETLLNAPSTLVPVQEKQDKEKVIADSIKEFVRKLIAKLPAPAETFADIVLGKEGVVNELISLFRGK